MTGNPPSPDEANDPAAQPPGEGRTRPTAESGTTESPLAEHDGLGRSAAVGTLWLTGQKWVIRVSGFVTIAVLTRLVSPEEFGVVAAAATVTPMVLLLADLGLTTFVVQTENADRRVLNTAFWFSISTALLLAGLMALTAPVIAAGLSIEGSTAILRAMALSVLATVPSAVPLALLRRRLKFRELAVQSTIATFVAQIVAIALALAGTGAWALVAQLIVTQGLVTIFAWRSARWIPQWDFSPSVLAEMASFGAKVVAVDILVATRAILEAAIVSNVLGTSALGYFNIAQRLVQVTQDVGAAAMVPVSTVVFAKVRNSAERLRTGYLKALRIGYAAVSPLLTFVAVGASSLVPLLFGPEWEPSVQVAQALAVAAILVLGSMIDSGLHYGVGAAGRWFGYELGVDTLIVGTTFFMAPHGLVWVARGFVVTSLIATMIRWVVVGRLVGQPARALAASFVVSMVPVVASALVGSAASLATQSSPALLRLAVIGLSIAVTHLVVLRIVSRGVLLDVVTMLPLPGRLATVKRWV